MICTNKMLEIAALPLDQRRRLFRPAARHNPRRHILALAAAMAGISLAALPVLGNRSMLGTPVLARIAAAPAQAAVVNGDTLRLGEQVVHLWGISAPARGRDCGAVGPDCGDAAAQALAALLRDQPNLMCLVRGQDLQGNTLAVCTAGTTELGRALVSGGWARGRPGAPDLEREEGNARAERRGLWAVAGASGW